MFRKENPGEYSLLATFKNKSLEGVCEGGWKGEGSLPSEELEDQRGPLHFWDVFFICSASVVR